MDDTLSEASVPCATDHRVDRINRKAIEEVAMKQSENQDKTIAIYYRPSPDHGLVPYMNKFSRAAAVAFSRTMASQLGDSGMYVVIDGPDMKPYKRIFDWIAMCVSVGNDERFPDVDDNDPASLYNLLDVMVAADKLRIPQGSLNLHLKKRLYPLARKHLIDLETVRRIYDDLDLDYAGLELQAVASTSIFEGWWRKQLDGEEYYDYMCELSDMRRNIKELDDDLHEAVNKKRQYFDELRERKKREREAMESSYHDMPTESGVGATGWNTASMVDNGGCESTHSSWDTGNHAVAENFDFAAGDNIVLDTSGSSWYNDTATATPTYAEEDTFGAGFNATAVVKWESLGDDQNTMRGSWADEVIEKTGTT